MADSSRTDGAAVVELADTHDSKSCGFTAMSVRLRPAAPLVRDAPQMK